MIPDQGTLNEMAPAKVLLSLYEQSKTGILYFRQNEILKVFYLNRGRISWAISSDDEDRIDHVLLAKRLVIPELLAPYQSGNKIAETFGKVLVENGVITLEVLIQATREQVQRIAASVLRWTSGNYQLVAEPPPTRLVSLDVDVPSLVAQYILLQMDVNIVWEELGSLSGELQQNPDPVKKGIYALDAEQQEVLSRFHQPQRLESVLLNFPAEGKYRILKMLYYFLLTGLLIRREANKAAPLDFSEMDGLFGQSPSSSVAEVDIEMPAMIDEAAIQDIPRAELPEITVEKAEDEDLGLPTLPDLMPPDRNEEAAAASRPARDMEIKEEKEQRRPQPFRLPEKQKPRWLSITFLSILVSAVLIGSFLWLTRSSAEPGQPDVQPVAAEKKEPASPSGTDGVNPAATPAEDSPLETGPAATTQEPAPQESAEDATPPLTPPSKTARTESLPQAKETGVAARALFDSGNFRAAGEAWREEIVSLQIKFSILLEMDCQKASVRSAFRQVEDKASFFLLNRSRDGRSCWLVLWGRYRTASEAALGMQLVPEYFLRQSNPPSVIELAPYL